MKPSPERHKRHRTLGGSKTPRDQQRAHEAERASYGKRVRLSLCVAQMLRPQDIPEKLTTQVTLHRNEENTGSFSPVTTQRFRAVPLPFLSVLQDEFTRFAGKILITPRGTILEVQEWFSFPGQCTFLGKGAPTTKWVGDLEKQQWASGSHFVIGVTRLKSRCPCVTDRTLVGKVCFNNIAVISKFGTGDHCATLGGFICFRVCFGSADGKHLCYNSAFVRALYTHEQKHTPRHAHAHAHTHTHSPDLLVLSSRVCGRARGLASPSPGRWR